MLKKLWQNIKKIILKDVSKESESNDFAILLRCLAIAEIIYLLLMSVFMAYFNNTFLCLSCVFNIGIMAAVLMLTYEDRTPAAMYLYIVAQHVLVVVSAIETEWRLYYTPIVLVCIMLFYFNARMSMKAKINYSICEIVYFVALLIAKLYLPMNTSLMKTGAAAVICLNIIIQVVSISFEAYAYSLKFTKNEEKMLQYNKKLEEMVSTDALTGLWNRRAMNEHLSLLENSFRKHQKSFAVAIMDIDFFKKVNDTYGHGMGDFVLKTLSALLKESMEGKGSVARWGGEEFLLTFEEMRYEEAVSLLNDIREKISIWDFSFKDVKIHLTITGGIEDYAMAESIDAVITKADMRLYTGKTGGRNRVVSEG